MIFTRFLKLAAWLLAIAFVFGIITQIVSFRRPFGEGLQQGIDVQRKKFAGILESSHATPEAAQKLLTAYTESQDDYERLLTKASKFMAAASTILVGLLSIVAFLWCRIRMMRASPNEALHATAAAPGS